LSDELQNSSQLALSTWHLASRENARALFVRPSAKS
jgi:hypothetical protein